VRGQLLPQISIIGDLNRSISSTGPTSAPNLLPTAAANLVTTSTLTANATMPVYEAGAIYSQTRQAQQTVGQRRSQLDDARRAAADRGPELGGLAGGADQYRLVRGGGARGNSLRPIDQAQSPGTPKAVGG
jgi:outer membrane protein TolC